MLEVECFSGYKQGKWAFISIVSPTITINPLNIYKIKVILFIFHISEIY